MIFITILNLVIMYFNGFICVTIAFEVTLNKIVHFSIIYRFSINETLSKDMKVTDHSTPTHPITFTHHTSTHSITITHHTFTLIILHPLSPLLPYRSYPPTVVEGVSEGAKKDGDGEPKEDEGTKHEGKEVGQRDDGPVS